MKLPSCPLCNSSQVARTFSVDDECDMFMCKKCGAGFLHPFPKNLYAEEYYLPYITSKSNLPGFIAKHIRDGRSASADWRHISRIREIESFICESSTGEGGRRLLDVGCGTGEFLRVAKELRFEAWGTEISEYARNFCRSQFGLNVLHPDSLNELPLTFDVITMWHILEHVEDPVKFLRMYLSKCCSGGLVVIEAPNWSSIMSKLRRKRWRFVRKDHLIYFTPDSLRYLLKSVGLRIVREKTTGSLGLTSCLERFWPHFGEFIKHHPAAIPIKSTYLNVCSITKIGDFYRIFAIKETV